MSNEQYAITPEVLYSPPGVPLVEVRRICKAFGIVQANYDINFSIYSGQIKALLGENGAGKSTLMSILAGRIEPDSGKILVNGVPTVFKSPKDAHSAGIGMVYQHFMLVDSMTVTENVLLGNEESFILRPREMEKRVSELAECYGLEVNPQALVGQLSMGERQRVEILKLLCRESRVLIFDEPTAVLTPKESRQLFAAMRRMTEQGKAIVFISHKLPEVLDIADNIAILRRGEIVDQFLRSQVPDETELARRMLGRELSRDNSEQEALDLRLVIGEVPLNLHTVAARTVPEAEAVLDLEQVCAPGVEQVSFRVAKGQILALVGVAGNGQKELVEMICGYQRPESGQITIQGLQNNEFIRRHPTTGGLAYIPEDRQGMGSCPQLNLVDNFLLTISSLFSGRVMMNRKRARVATKALIADYKISPPKARTLGRSLSGGNLQKLIIGRELLRNPICIVAENPTQGLDVAATEEVWRRLRIARESSAILLVTGDLNEALALADFIGVMYRGKIVDIFSITEQLKIDSIGLMMTGASVS